MTEQIQPRDHGKYSFKQQGAPTIRLGEIGEPREMTREELIITGQAVENNPALSEVTRQVHHNRLALAQAVKAMDETMLNATIIHAKQIFPGAKELRMRAMSLGGSDGRMTPTFIRTADDQFLGARFDKSESGNWASRAVEGAEPGSIDEAVYAISAHSEIWDTDPRCEYDPQTEEHVLYLDGRRSSAHTNG